MDKSREQFEAWVYDYAMKHNYQYMDIVLISVGDEYATTWVDNMWIGWKASRAAVEIKLPFYCEGYVHDPELIDEITTHGLKVRK